MKKILLLSSVLFLASCEKCYKCVTTSSSYNTQGEKIGETKSETNFCGTPAQKTKHEKESSHSENGYAQSKTVTQMTCTIE